MVLNSGRLADAVRADHADDAVARQRERQTVDERAVAEGLLQALGLDDDGAQARTGRDLDLLEVELARALGLGGHLLVAGQARLGLGLAALGVRADPLQLVLEALGQLGVLLALDVHAGGLLLQVRGVVALVGVGAAAVELEDPLRDVVEEVPVVGDGQDGTGVLARCCSSHVTDSASRWLVARRAAAGPGASSSSLHSATRRFSPPDSTDTSASPGGQRSASMACSSWESMSHALAWSSSSCSVPISAMRASKSASGSSNRPVISL